MQQNDVLDKINALGSDTIMGAAMNTEFKEAEEKLQKAVEENVESEEKKDNEAVNSVLTGDSLNAIQNPIYYQKTRPIVRDNKKIGRNDPCPCGALDENGKPKKYKNCCMSSGKYETTHFE